MAYSKTDLDLIRNKIDMLTFLEGRGVSFRQSGVSWIGLCPSHSERTPSFHVRPGTQTFHCFGCGIHGDIFSLVEEMDGLSFPGAVQYLAEEAGIQLKVDEDPNFKRRQRLYTITRLASEWYRWNYNQIPMDHPAKKNLEERNLLEYSLSDESVGFAPAGGLVPLLEKKGFTLQEIENAGIVKTPDDGGAPRERFRNRLIWTVYDIQGKPVGFSARKIFENDNGPKYLNSPQTELYNKSKVLLGLSDAKRVIAQTQEVYVVEGQTDVMALKAAGKINTVASCGTAFGSDHANMLLHLSKLGRDADKFKIIFCFDSDNAGLKAAKSVFEKNSSINLNSYVVKFEEPNGEATDPCDYRKAHGNEALLHMVGNDTQVSIVEFVLSEARKEWDITTPEGQSGFVNRSREILSHVSDPVQHSSYIRKIAYWTGLPFSELGNMLRQKPSSSYNKPSSQEEVKNGEIKLEGDKFENNILAAFVQYPQESLALMTELKMGTNFFPTRRELAFKIIEQIDKDGLDYSDTDVSILSHIDLGISEERKDYGLRMLFKNYFKYLHSQEMKALNAKFASNPDSGAFEFLLKEQHRINQMYKS